MSQLLFPSLPGITWPVARIVVPPTVREKLAGSGRSFRARDGLISRYRYQLAFEFLRIDQAHLEWQQLMGFYNRVGASFDDWLFEDLDDHTCTAQLFDIGDGVRTQFQLARTLGSFVEPVYGPLTWAITSAGVAVAPAVSSTGLVTFGAAPAAGAELRWTGTFAWRCIFEGESLEFTKNFATFYEARRVQFITTKPN